MDANLDSLGVLMAMVNETLIETGRFFRAEGSLQASTLFKRSIPSAHGQFQRALDDLSQQIFIAKAFLERDYDAILAKRNPPAATGAEGSTDEVSTIPTPPKAENGISGTDVSVKKEDVSPQEPRELMMRTSTEDASTKPAEGAVKLEKPPDQDVAGPDVAQISTPNPAPTPAGGGAGAGEDTDEINFDSILNETSNDGPNEFDLHLDFGNDDMGNQNFLAQSNYLPPQQQPPPPLSDGRPSHMEDFGAAGESSFNDLFMDGDDFGGDGGGGGGGEGDTDVNMEGDGLMNLDELDSNWFDT